MLWLLSLFLEWWEALFLLSLFAERRTPLFDSQICEKKEKDLGKFVVSGRIQYTLELEYIYPNLTMYSIYNFVRSSSITKREKTAKVRIMTSLTTVSKIWKANAYPLVQARDGPNGMHGLIILVRPPLSKRKGAYLDFWTWILTET